MTTITIHTRLDAGIYRSSGGGQDCTHYTWTAGPLNLLHAAQKLPEHRASMVSGYGNIGCGRTWLQIGEQCIDSADLPETLDGARDLLQRVASGAYAAELARLAQIAAQEAQAENARLAAEIAREIADTEADHRRAEEAQRAADAAADAAERAAWAARQQAEAEAAAADRAMISARQTARDIGRQLRRDWRRAGC